MRRLFVNAILTGVVPEGVLLKCGSEMDRVEVLPDGWLLVEDGIIAGFGPMGLDHSEDGTVTGYGSVSHGNSDDGVIAECHDRADNGVIAMSHSCVDHDLIAESHDHSDNGLIAECHGRADHGALGREGAGIGRAGECAALPAADEIIDCRGAMLMPAFCDSHTHIVYAGSREGEFLDKINGLSYEQIASRGGGILNSAQRLHDTSEDELYAQAMERVAEMMRQGTGSIEIKSGYGLNPQDELKMLRVIDRIKRSAPALVRTTFLGAHAVGRGYSHSEYVSAVCDMMPEAASLADFVDIFCERGFFTTDDAERILACGRRCGLRGKIHANQLSCSGGVQVGVKCGALSVDHLEQTGPEEIAALLASLESWRAAGDGRSNAESCAADTESGRSFGGGRSNVDLESGRATGDGRSAVDLESGRSFGGGRSAADISYGGHSAAAPETCDGASTFRDGSDLGGAASTSRNECDLGCGAFTSRNECGLCCGASTSRNECGPGCGAFTSRNECGLCDGPTIATMLPGSSFFLGLPYGRGREFIDSGLPIALASDFNPGSAPSGDMRFVMALGCIKMKLTPERAFNAATLNGAYAMGVSRLAGSITPGKRADLILAHPGWNLTRIAYLHHTPFVRNIFIRGEKIL